MIKNFEPQPYDGLNPLPSYVTNVSSFTLTGSVPGGYEITLAKLTVGESVSAGNPLSLPCLRALTTTAQNESHQNPRERV